jgi:hypothetical protein
MIKHELWMSKLYKFIEEVQTIVDDESDHDEYDLRITIRKNQRIWKNGKMR